MANTRALWRILRVRNRKKKSATRRAGRLALAVLVLVVAVVLTTRFGVGVYLNSSRGKAAFAKDLQSMIGMPVEVADVDLGARSSAVKFRVLDPLATGPDRVEVLSVESAAADVSFAEVMARRMAPTHVELTGVALSLRVAADGTILTPIPPIPDGPGGVIPRVVVERGRVAVKQDGVPDFAVAGVSVKVEPDGDAVKLSGAIDDPSWGKWAITGRVDRATRIGWAEFTTAAALGWEKWRAIPFVSAGAWYCVPIDGGVTIRVAIGEDRQPRFTVTARPKE